MNLIRLLTAVKNTPGHVPGLSVFLGLFFILATFSSQPVFAHSEEKIATTKLPVATAVFDTQGRLWRLLIGQYHVFVDYSDDAGLSFSSPVKVNAERQNILASAEDRPALTLSKDGRMVVIYASNKPHTYSRYYSHSKDGLNFTKPVLISGNDKSRAHSQNRAVFTADGELYLFWLQEQRGTPAMLFYSSTRDLDKPMRKVDTLVGSMCDCCRLGIALNQQDRPVIAGRFLFGEDTRDMGIVSFNAAGVSQGGRRVSQDDWRINACPHHGPSLSIDEQNRHHMVWFTQGDKRKGLFYAQSVDAGQTFGEALGFGNPRALASHADVLALGDRVVIVWREYDGDKTSIRSIQSTDAGQRWSTAATIKATVSDGDQPFLISDGTQIFLSWNASDLGYQLVKID